MQFAQGTPPAWQCKIGWVLWQGGFELEFGAPSGQGGLDFDLGEVNGFAGSRFIFLGQCTEPLEEGGELAVGAENGNACLLESGQITGILDLGHCGLFYGFDLIKQSSHNNDKLKRAKFANKIKTGEPVRSPVHHWLKTAGNLSLGGFGFQSVLGNFDQGAKSGVVGRSDIGKDLAIKGHLGGLQAFHEAAVGGAGRAGGGIDADLPQIAEGAFLNAAIAIGILAAVINSVRGVTVKLRTAHPVAFSGVDHPCSAFAGGRCVCNSHGLFLKYQ
ncbi:hypothetical protein SDC9_149610 [bioreactor metagenome]|uniref:Uncharacterized protein n=1 Tax=bioreactor metagenome TaxID=1076179 RepID=A0A645EP32_9ZZZZ